MILVSLLEFPSVSDEAVVVVVVGLGLSVVVVVVVVGPSMIADLCPLDASLTDKASPTPFGLLVDRFDFSETFTCFLFVSTCFFSSLAELGFAVVEVVDVVVEVVDVVDVVVVVAAAFDVAVDVCGGA